MANIITLNPGESLMVVATAPPAQPPLGIWDRGDPRPTLPIAGWDPGTGNFPNPPTEPPPVDPPAQEEGYYTWAWSDQAQRWVWVKVPGEGEAGPK